MPLDGHGERKYVRGTRLDSSAGLGWRGVLAERWRHGAGPLPAIEPRETEIVLLTRGRLAVRRRGDGRLQRAAAVPGTVWLCPAGIREDMIHLYGDIEESLHIYLPDATLAAVALEDLDADPARLALRYGGGFPDPTIERLGHAVLADLRRPGPEGALRTEYLAHALAAHILQRHAVDRQAGKAPASARGALDPRRQRRVLDHIADNLSGDLGLEQLAATACLSRYHFARAFKAAFGCPPYRYVMARRLERAQLMLRHGGLPLKDIAQACGFGSTAQLSRAFSQANGHPPAAWRDAIRSESGTGSVAATGSTAFQHGEAVQYRPQDGRHLPAGDAVARKGGADPVRHL